MHRGKLETGPAEPAAERTESGEIESDFSDEFDTDLDGDEK